MRVHRSLLAVALVLPVALAVASPGSTFCFGEAARAYDLPTILLEVIAEVESGMNPNAAGWNPDGSVDVGLMQINSWWENRLGRKRWIAVCTDPCYNVMTGAWILADCLQRYGYTMEGVGCYNALSPEKRTRYSEKIYQTFLSKMAPEAPE